ncbi:UNVERIFIED_CONTAM: hypothetical protein HDU68_000997, partial [Siphonaria sp. JEL0065]
MNTTDLHRILISDILDLRTEIFLKTERLLDLLGSPASPLIIKDKIFKPFSSSPNQPKGESVVQQQQHPKNSPVISDATPEELKNASMLSLTVRWTGQDHASPDLEANISHPPHEHSSMPSTSSDGSITHKKSFVKLMQGSISPLARSATGKKAKRAIFKEGTADKASVSVKSLAEAAHLKKSGLHLNVGGSSSLSRPPPMPAAVANSGASDFNNDNVKHAEIGDAKQTNEQPPTTPPQPQQPQQIDQVNADGVFGAYTFSAKKTQKKSFPPVLDIPHNNIQSATGPHCKKQDVTFKDLDIEKGEKTQVMSEDEKITTPTKNYDLQIH